MKSKTLTLINKYHRLLKEQGEDPQPQQGMEGPEDPQSVQDVVDPNQAQGEGETMPMTSEGEEQYISDLIDAALYKPSPEDAKTLVNLQSVMSMKRFQNAREDVLPMVLSIISAETQAGSLKNQLTSLD